MKKWILRFLTRPDVAVLRNRRVNMHFIVRVVSLAVVSCIVWGCDDEAEDDGGTDRAVCEAFCEVASECEPISTTEECVQSCIENLVFVREEYGESCARREREAVACASELDCDHQHGCEDEAAALCVEDERVRNLHDWAHSMRMRRERER
jgi:hypothetical protein